jgi:hypothetical protein
LINLGEKIIMLNAEKYRKEIEDLDYYFSVQRGSLEMCNRMCNRCDFARCENNKIFTWRDGLTNWIASNGFLDYIEGWDYAKLVEEV